MTWVYFLKEKTEAFATFKKFKALVEKQKRSQHQNHFAVIEEVNTQVENLNNIAKIKAFRSNLQQCMLLNKYLKEEIEQ